MFDLMWKSLRHKYLYPETIEQGTQRRQVVESSIL